MCGKTFRKPITQDQFVCSYQCLLDYWEHELTGKRGKAKARRLAATMGLRSLGEVKLAARLEAAKVAFRYESTKLTYTPPQRRYIADFEVRTKSGKTIYLEYKGIFKGTDRTKMLLVHKENPDVDIRFIFEKPNNKLSKASKTTYAQWCEKHGFLWAEKEPPDEWLKE